MTQETEGTPSSDAASSDQGGSLNEYSEKRSHDNIITMDESAIPPPVALEPAETPPPQQAVSDSNE